MRGEDKVDENSPTPPHNQSRQHYFHKFVVITAIAASLWLLINRKPWRYQDDVARCYHSQDFNWEKLTPSSSLRWVECYPEFQCARLEVPLNYKEVNGPKAAIAMIRYPAKVRRDGTQYKGPILFNPGGPGGPGVDFIKARGKYFQSITGGEFDIIGFDPRGIGQTTPSVNVFETPLQRLAWDIRVQEAPLFNETSSAIIEAAARSRVINSLVAQKASTAAKNVNTAVVCRDMLSIVQAHGFAKLQFWGFSYGSVIGTTFAALYPENVGRIIVDGVMDADNYYAGRWDNSLRLTDGGLDLMFEQCAEAESECGLYETTGAKVKRRYMDILASLDRKPVIVSKDGLLAVITPRMVKSTLFEVLAAPYRDAKRLFHALRDLERGNGTTLYTMGRWAAQDPDRACDCNHPGPKPQFGQDVEASVMCTDAGPVEWDVEAFQRHYEKLAASSYFGDIWSHFWINCVGWQVKPNNPWSGPISGNTSFPILLIRNRYDPQTPDAEMMSHRFPGSVFFEQNSAGHCSIAAASICTAKIVRAYFHDGTLPTPGTVCEVEDHMFLDTKIGARSQSRGDARLLDSIRDFERTSHLQSHWRGL